MEFGIATHTDIGKTIPCLPDITWNMESLKNRLLIAQAEQLSSLSKDPIIARLKAIQRGEASTCLTFTALTIKQTFYFYTAISHAPEIMPSMIFEARLFVRLSISCSSVSP